MGEQTARLLAGHFRDLDDLGRADAETLQALPDVGPEVAASIRNFYESPANRAQLERFRELGLWPLSPLADANGAETAQTQAGPLQGKNVLFTGTLSLPRGKVQHLAEAAGAVLAGSVNKKLDFLVVGDKPGGKLDKARALGLAVLDEAGFRELLAASGIPLDHATE